MDYMSEILIVVHIFRCVHFQAGIKFYFPHIHDGILTGVCGEHALAQTNKHIRCAFLPVRFFTEADFNIFIVFVNPDTALALNPRFRRR